VSRNNDIRRRFGVIFLALALGMLIAGQTVLRDRLGGLGFVFFWLACFAFTFLAILVAALDAAAIRRRARAEQHRFLKDTLEEIARKKAAKSRGPEESPGDLP
jgi:membrane protein implicated in regulation of membrane protease activity